MRVFNDCQGRSWEIDLNIAEARPLSEWLDKEMKIDLFKPADFTAVAGNVLQAMDILSFLCRKQRQERDDMTDADFGRAFKGACAYDAQKALIEEYNDFFPNPQMQATLDKCLRSILRANDVQRLLVEMTITDIERGIQSINSAIEKGGSITSPNLQDADVSEPHTKRSRGESSKKSPKRATKGVGKRRAR